MYSISSLCESEDVLCISNIEGDESFEATEIQRPSMGWTVVEVLIYSDKAEENVTLKTYFVWLGGG